jgi:hypothetical protein
MIIPAFVRTSRFWLTLRVRQRVGCRTSVVLVMVEKRTDPPEKPIVVSKTEARQATTVRGMLSVLAISTVGAFIVLAGLYIYYFGLPF